jgi:hypothetical protein
MNSQVARIVFWTEQLRIFSSSVFADSFVAIQNTSKKMERVVNLEVE